MIRIQIDLTESTDDEKADFFALPGVARLLDYCAHALRPLVELRMLTRNDYRLEGDDYG